MGVVLCVQLNPKKLDICRALNEKKEEGGTASRVYRLPYFVNAGVLVTIPPVIGRACEVLDGFTIPSVLLTIITFRIKINVR